MRGRLAVGLAGTAVVVLVWAGAGGDDADPDPDLAPGVTGVATSGAPDQPGDVGQTSAGGLVVVQLDPVAADPPPGSDAAAAATTTTAEDAAEAPALRWEVDLALATQQTKAATCGTWRGLRLSVLDGGAEGAIVGLVLRGDVATAGVDVAVAGAFLDDEDAEVPLSGTTRLEAPAEVGGPPGLRSGRLSLTDADGQSWQGTFRCQGPPGEPDGAGRGGT